MEDDGTCAAESTSTGPRPEVGHAVELFGGPGGGQASRTCTSVEELISQASADVAKAVALFGPGVTVLPVVGHLSGVVGSACLSYEAYSETSPAVVEALGSDAAAEKGTFAGAAFTDRASAVARFGPLDPETVIRELDSRDAPAVNVLVADLSDGELQAEVDAFQSWRNQAAGRIALLERRAAWALVGLEEGSTTSAAEVRRAFKRRALTLHPDKGGDAKRFQLLQEMKQILVKPLEKGKSKDGDEEEEGSESDSDHAEEEEARAKVQQEESSSKAEDASSTVFDRSKVESERWKLHREVCDLWQRCEQLGAEIEQGPAAGSGNADRVLQRLRGFVYHFMASNASASALEAVHRFLEEGAEVLGAASAVDPAGTSSIVSLYVGVPLAARSSASPEVQQIFAALVEAIHQVPQVLQRHVMTAIRCMESQQQKTEQTEAVASADQSDPSGDAGEEPAVITVCAPASWDEKLATHDCAGARRPDGSAVYCTACDCWVALMPPFNTSSFFQHCDTDAMHGMLTGVMA